VAQAGAHGILPVFATWNDRPHFSEVFSADNRFDFIKSIFPGDNNNFVHRAGALKCVYRVRDNWFAGNRSKQFVKTHAAAITGRNDDDG
jgi:hypothetical protein